MRAVQFDLSIPRYALLKTFGRFLPTLHWHSTLSCIRYRTLPDIALPSDDWVKIEVIYSGICGSDLNLIFLHDSPKTSPYASFPFTLGHEIVGRVIEKGKNVKDINIGERVVVDPVLSCRARGFENLCPACEQGDDSLCQNMTEGNISPGLLIGSCKDTGGGWSTAFVAHQSQVIKLPEEVNDLNGVMVEPFSCALHAIMRNPPKPNDTVLVIGAGVIGICVVAALRALEYPVNIVVLAKHAFQAKLAEHFGANHVVRLSRTHDYYKAVADQVGGKLLKPVLGPPVLHGGADMVVECVGNTKSVNDALSFTKHAGKVVLLGLTSILDKIDWTTVWMKELEIKGSFCYSTEYYKGEQRRTLDIAVQLIKEGKVDLSPLVTHRYPLDQYQLALQTATQKSKGKVMKVLLHP